MEQGKQNKTSEMINNKTVPRFGLVGEHPPSTGIRAGTANLIKTFCSHPGHPFCAVAATDHAGPEPISGPWDTIPTLSLFRPRALFPNLSIGLGLLDSPAFNLQKKRVARFFQKHHVQRQFVLIANNARFASFAASLPLSQPRDVYIVDDFVADSPIYRVDQKKAQYALDKLVNESERVFTISPIYAQDLQQQYRRKCHFLPIPIAESLLETIDKSTDQKNQNSSPPGTQNAIVIHHAGQIHHLYADALAHLITLLEDIAQQKKQHIRLELWGRIYAPDIEQLLKTEIRNRPPESYFSIKVCGEVSPDELNRQQRKANFLLLVNSFLPHLEKQMRCSFSSKITEYLVSGTPVLLYAPTYSSLTVHLAQHQAAHIVSAPEATEAKNQLAQILSATNNAAIVNAAQNLARTVHSGRNFFDKIIS